MKYQNQGIVFPIIVLLTCFGCFSACIGEGLIVATLLHTCFGVQLSPPVSTFVALSELLNEDFSFIAFAAVGCASIIAFSIRVLAARQIYETEKDGTKISVWTIIQQQLIILTISFLAISWFFSL